MKNLSLAFLLLSMLAGCGHMPLRTVDNLALRECDEVVQSGIDGGIYPGAVLVVGNEDAILYAKTYGRHTYEDDAPPMQFDTLFDLASVSKVVGTSLAAFANMDDGRLALDDPVAQHIKGFEAHGKGGVTIKDLMTHVSGLTPYENYRVVKEKQKPDESNADALIRHYAAMELNYPPRSKSRYSCLNFQTMARVNENASGMRQEDLLIKRVYGPLRMTDTRYVLSDEQRLRTAPTIRRKNGELVKGDVHDPLANYHGSIDHCPGNAGLYSTAQDMTTFCRMVLGEGAYRDAKIYRPEIIRMATRRQTPESIEIIRGLGFQIYTEPPWMTESNRTPENRIVDYMERPAP